MSQPRVASRERFGSAAPSQSPPAISVDPTTCTARPATQGVKRAASTTRAPTRWPMSQPAPGTPTGRQSSSHSATPPTHPTHVSHTQRSAAHRRAIQTRRQHRRGPACHIGARVPHHQELTHGSDTWQQGGVMASQPRVLHHLQAARPPRATTLIHHHAGDTSGQRFHQGPPLKHFASAPGLCAK